MKNWTKTNEKKIGEKVKCICTHCGKKQIAEEKNYSIQDVPCNKCLKEGNLERI